MKNQEGGSSAIVLTLAGVIITGIVGSMAYSMVGDVDNRQKMNPAMGQEKMNGSEAMGKGIGQIASIYKNRPKDDKDDDDDFNISNRKCSHAEAAQNPNKENFKNICITEIQAMSKKIDEILNDLKVPPTIYVYVNYLKKKLKDHTEKLYGHLNDKGASDFLKTGEFDKLMEWYEIINRKNNLKDESALNQLLHGTKLEHIISYDELFKNERIGDYIYNKSEDIIEYAQTYNPDDHISSWDPINGNTDLTEDDFVLLKTKNGSLINVFPKYDIQVSQSIPIDIDDSDPGNKLVKGILNGVDDIKYYKLKEEDPEDIKLKHLGKILVYMLKNKKGFFSNVSNVFSRNSSKNDKVEGERSGPTTHINQGSPSVDDDESDDESDGESYGESDDESDDESDKKYEKFMKLLTDIDTEKLKEYVDEEVKEIKNNIKREELLKQKEPTPKMPAPAEEPAAEEPAEEPAPAAEPQKRTARFHDCSTSDDCEEPNQTCDINENICVSVK